MAQIKSGSTVGGSAIVDTADSRLSDSRTPTAHEHATLVGDVTLTDGNLVIGASGKGIDFSNQASPAAGMTSELLDHYEEGTFTPTYGTSGVDFTSVTPHEKMAGFYTRIGREVYVQVLLRTDAITKGSASGDVQITGLPFTCVSGNLSALAVGYAANFLVDAPIGGILGSATSARATLYKRATAPSLTTALQVADLDTGSSKNYIYVNFAYRVA